MENHDEIARLEAAIKDLDFDYMRGWVSEDEYQTKMDALKSSLIEVGGTPPTPTPRIEVSEDCQITTSSDRKESNCRSSYSGKENCSSDEKDINRENISRFRSFSS